MDQLPQELIDKVGGFLPKEDLKHVLTLSTKFRYAAERHSGAFSEFQIGEGNAEKFVDTYSGHRLRYLRNVIFRPRLSRRLQEDYPEEIMPCHDSKEELQQTDEQFTSQIQFLLATLKSTEDRAGDRNSPGRYRLEVFSPERLVTSASDSNTNCLHHHYVGWRVRLLDASRLSKVMSVRSLAIHNDGYICGDLSRCSGEGYYSECYISPDHSAEDLEIHDVAESRLDLGVVVDLATTFPNLQFLTCKIGAGEWNPVYWDKYTEEDKDMAYEYDWQGPRRDSRHQFAKTVAARVAQLPQSLRAASLDFLSPIENTIMIHQARALPDLVYPADKDPFSSSLRILTNSLRHLRLCVMADQSLFSSDTDATPSWPNLEIFDVMFHAACPNGTWYFQGPLGEGRSAKGYRVTGADYPPYETTENDERMDNHNENYGFQRGEFSTSDSQFRIRPDDSKVGPLLESFAKAAISMPALKKATIWASLSFFRGDWEDLTIDTEEADIFYQQNKIFESDNYAWGIVFYEPGVHALKATREEHPPIPSRQLWWLVANWRPDKQLHSLFQEIGRGRYGEELTESWAQYQHGGSLPFRENFEQLIFEEDFGNIK